MSKPQFFLRLAITLGMFAFGWYLLPQLPAMIPTHWNYAGVADAFGQKTTSVWLFPGIALAMTLLFPFLKKLDPKGENYEKFASVWETIQTSLIMFFAHAYVLSLLAALPSLAPQIDISRYMMLGIGALFIVLGNFMGKIRRNYFIGFKLPWTLTSDEVWNKTHRVAGKCMLLSGIILALNGWFKFAPLGLFIVAMIIMVILPMIYSYILFRKSKQ